MCVERDNSGKQMKDIFVVRENGQRISSDSKNSHDDKYFQRERMKSLEN